MSNILVTGGTGFLGAHILYYLTKNNNNPIAIKRKSSSLENVKKIFLDHGDINSNLFNKIIWKELDLLDFYNVGDSLKNIDVIFHVAAIVSFNQKMKDQLLETNFFATKNLVNFSLLHNVSKFYFISSVATLSKNFNQEFFDEESWFSWSDKKSNYAVSKYLAEMEVWRGFSEGLKGCIINPSLIIGPGDTNGLFSNMIKKLGNKSIFYPKGSSGFVDVRDVAQIIIRLNQMNITNERYIVNGHNLSFKKLLLIFSEKTNTSKPSIPISRSVVNIYLIGAKIFNTIIGQNTLLSREMLDFLDGKLKYSNQKITKKLNYKFIDFKRSLEDTINTL